jgi:transposase
VVRRRDDQSGRSLRCGRPKKGGPDDEPEDHALGRSRGGFSTKIHVATDGHGVPLGVVVAPGQEHDSKTFEEVITAARVPATELGRSRSLPKALAADKGYSYRHLREWLRRRKVERVIPQRENQVGQVGGHRVFDRGKYRQRSVVEQCLGWLKECRRVLTRFEKLAVNYLAVVKLAFVERYLRLLTS